MTSSILPKRRKELSAVGVGLMLTPPSGVRIDAANDYAHWAADNGCFSQGDSFELGKYLAWLEAMKPANGHCLFATAPDVVGNAPATWERSRLVLPMIRELGYKAALVAQDGWDASTIDWFAFDALFIGGTTEFKLSEPAYLAAKEAREHGKWSHMGRVNSWRRLKAAAVSGYDSADGTMLAFMPDRRLSQLLGWMRTLNQQRYFLAH